MNNKGEWIAMGSLVSVVIAILYMEDFEEKALASTPYLYACDMI